MGERKYSCLRLLTMASLRELREEIKEGLHERKCKNRGLNTKRTELMTAIRNQHVEKVDRLLNQGVDPNFYDAAADYPLHVACASPVTNNSNGAEQILELLLYMGADQEAYDRFSRLPLHIAATNSVHMVQVLLDRGCSINAQDNAGCTALMEACSYNRSDPVDTVSLLLQYNADVHLRDEKGFTALHCICQSSEDPTQRNQIALLLLHAGLSTTVCDHAGRMALCYEMDKITSISYRMFPKVDLQLLETLVCAGSNLLHSSKDHQYWIRYVANSSSPKVLSGLLQMFSPVLTRPCLRLIHKAVISLNAEDDEDDGTACLQGQVQSLMCSLDSLQAICRRSVRANLRGNLLTGVPKLPLPNKLKNFLTSLDRKPA